jgi:DNA-binding NarL/FixJ family response regulator
MSIRILIADDDVSIRRLLRRLLEDRSGWQVCGEAANGQEAVFQAEKLTPDIAVLDLAMPCMNGLEAAREISKLLPHPSMLLLTVQEVSTQLVKEARDAGFLGAVSKATGAEVIKGIESLLQHQPFFNPSPAALSVFNSSSPS